MLTATSLGVRALIRPYSTPTARAQLAAGLTLLGVGLPQVWFGPQILTAITDVLGATANAGIFLVELVARVVGLTALPMGIAVLAIQPLVRLTQIGQVHLRSAGPPDLESLN